MSGYYNATTRAHVFSIKYNIELLNFFCSDNARVKTKFLLAGGRNGIIV